MALRVLGKLLQFRLSFISALSDVCLLSLANELSGGAVPYSLCVRRGMGM